MIKLKFFWPEPLSESEKEINNFLAQRGIIYVDSYPIVGDNKRPIIVLVYGETV